MKKNIILIALISFIAISFTVKSQTTFDTRVYQLKIVINKNELFFKEIPNFNLPEPVEYKEGNEVTTPRKLPAISKPSYITFNSGVFNNVAKNADWSSTKNTTIAEIYLMDNKGKTIQHWTIANALITSVKCANKTAAVVKIDSMVISGNISN